MNVVRHVAADNGALATLMRQRQHRCMVGRTQRSVGTDAVIRQRKVGTTEEERKMNALKTHRIASTSEDIAERMKKNVLG